MSQWQPQQHDPSRQPPAVPPQWQQPQSPQSYPPQFVQPFVQAPVHANVQQLAVHPRSPAAALVMSLFIPGLGSMYAGKAGWGILIVALWLVSWPMLFFAIGLITLPACWIWGMIAGYSDARAWNRARGIES